MKKNNIFFITIIIFLLILVIIFLINKNNKIESPPISNNVYQNDISVIKDKKIEKIIDIHKNIDNYLGKEEKITGQFIEFNDGFSVGIMYSFEDGEEILFDIIADFSNIDLPKLNVYDWIEVTGIIQNIEEYHEEHIHNAPMIVVSSLKKINPK